MLFRLYHLIRKVTPLFLDFCEWTEDVVIIIRYQGNLLSSPWKLAKTKTLPNGLWLSIYLENKCMEEHFKALTSRNPSTGKKIALTLS